MNGENLLTTADSEDSHNEFNTLFNIIVSGGERTRGIIYFLGLMSAALLAIIVESNLFNWSASRYQQVASAFACYTHHLKSESTVPTTEADHCGPHYDYVRKYYLIDVPNDLTGYHYEQTWNALNERYNLLTKEYVEGASTTLPIIGIKIDKGNAFVFGMFISISILYTLRLSVNGEIATLLNIRPLLTNRNKVESILRCHVFAGPRINSHKFWWFLFIPFAMISGDVGINLSKSDLSHTLLSADLGNIFIILQIILSVFLLIVTGLCFKAASELDSKLYEINSLFVSECV